MKFNHLSGIGKEGRKIAEEIAAHSFFDPNVSRLFNCLVNWGTSLEIRIEAGGLLCLEVNQSVWNVTRRLKRMTSFM